LIKVYNHVTPSHFNIRRITMPTLYTRTFNLKESLTDAEVLAYWTFLQEEFIPAALKVPGIRSVKLYSGAGALRADLLALFELDDAAAYERLLVDPEVRKLLGKTYGPWDLTTATQSFRREVTPELVRALSSTR
jgi:hypothetical protein